MTELLELVVMNGPTLATLAAMGAKGLAELRKNTAAAQGLADSVNRLDARVRRVELVVCGLSLQGGEHENRLDALDEDVAELAPGLGVKGVH